MRVLLTQAAQHDVAEAADWFEQQRKGQGSQFLDRVAEGLAAIELSPLAYPKLTGENRRCVTAEFPYALWFKLTVDLVVVAGVRAEREPAVVKSPGDRVIPFPRIQPKGPHNT